MKITVDFDLCESNGLCEGLAPDVFELDDDDYLVVKKDDIGPEDLDSVRRAVASCPRAAISLQEAGSEA
jgi:ferredoxin